MEWLLGWLQTQVPIGHVWVFALYSILSIFVLNFVTILILPKRFTEPPPFNPYDPSSGSYLHFKALRPGIPILTWEFPGHVFSLAVMEEMVFRFALLGGAVQIWGAAWPVLLIIIISSIIFGLMHGDPVNVLIQGVGGVVFCIVFLKCGGFDQNFLMALMIVAITHCIFNTIVAFFNLLGGQPYL